MWKPNALPTTFGKEICFLDILLGKKITKDLTVIYKNDIESSVVFEYKVNKNVNVESQAGRKSSIDIFYKQDY
jgi:autotransporter translocation and assembly factor TamB